MNHRTRSNAIGVAFVTLCVIATSIIVAMLAVILGQIVWNGAQELLRGL